MRIPFVRRCILDGAGESIDAMLLDLSLRGVYVATDEAPAVGAKMTVRFRVPGNDRQLSLDGLVAWVQGQQTHPVHGLPRGFGLRFTSLDAEDVRVITRAIYSYCASNPLYRQYL